MILATVVSNPTDRGTILSYVVYVVPILVGLYTFHYCFLSLYLFFWVPAVPSGKLT